MAIPALFCNGGKREVLHENNLFGPKCFELGEEYRSINQILSTPNFVRDVGHQRWPPDNHLYAAVVMLEHRDIGNGINLGQGLLDVYRPLGQLRARHQMLPRIDDANPILRRLLLLARDLSQRVLGSLPVDWVSNAGQRHCITVLPLVSCQRQQVLVNSRG